MHIEHQKSLKPYNTFGIDAKAKHFCAVGSATDLIDILQNKNYPDKFILGGGSNMLLTQDIDALVVHVNIRGIKVLSKTDNHVLVRAHAGENWHDFVLWCISKNFGGIENLSLIPGNVGTAPIQNIGAYGVELKDVFYSCDAISVDSYHTRTFSKDECQFDYRNSTFKNENKGKYVITSVVFKLTTNHHKLNIDYGAIKDELSLMKVTEPNIQDISNAVITIRESKLPNPKEIGNSGSFFKNPIISIKHYKTLQENFPNIPSYKVSEDEVKVPAGWLIEHAGFKGKRFGDYGVHAKQALVLVNYKNAEGKDIFELSKLIQSTISRIFNINLEAEVNII